MKSIKVIGCVALFFLYFFLFMALFEDCQAQETPADTTIGIKISKNLIWIAEKVSFALSVQASKEENRATDVKSDFYIGFIGGIRNVKIRTSFVGGVLFSVDGEDKIAPTFGVGFQHKLNTGERFGCIIGAYLGKVEDGYKNDILARARLIFSLNPFDLI